MKNNKGGNMAEKETKTTFSGMKYAWIVGALIFVVAAWFGLKTILPSFGEYKITLVDAPKQVEEGNVATFTWRVDGPPTTINHTVVHYGTESNPGEMDTDTKPADTKYTDFVKDFVSGEYGVPLQFIGNAGVAKQGKYYYRAYATIKGKNYWSDEYSFEVIPATHRVSVIAAPSLPAAGNIVSFTWRVTGPSAVADQTAVYIGTESNPGDLGEEVVPDDTTYTSNTKEFLKGEYQIPLQFVGNVKVASAGSYFYRGHAVIDGKNYWSEEGTFEVK